jgi:hypothetical protein
MLNSKRWSCAPGGIRVSVTLQPMQGRALRTCGMQQWWYWVSRHAGGETSGGYGRTGSGQHCSESGGMVRMGRNGGAREGGRRSARLWLVSAHWGKALGKVKCPSGGSATDDACRQDEAWWWQWEGFAQCCSEQGVLVELLAVTTVLLLLYGLCWLEPGTQICRTQGG